MARDGGRPVDGRAAHRVRGGAPERDFTGAGLLEKGFTCRLENTRSAEIMVLTKKPATSASSSRG
jgi:hypothetical protein